MCHRKEERETKSPSLSSSSQNVHSADFIPVNEIKTYLLSPPYSISYIVHVVEANICQVEGNVVYLI